MDDKEKFYRLYCEMIEKDVMSHCTHYNWLLRNVAVPLLSNSTTYMDELQKFGNRAFGRKFHGVYMRDTIPRTFNSTRPYGIINLDRTTELGSHWIAVAFQQPHHLLVYDSFGALHKTPRELVALYGKSTVTDPDAEQRLDEKNCGARCMAWLLLAECFPDEPAFI